ncbi:Cmx/CmrA family chloramphenicol efflux MFS transporter [Brevibacterium sp. GP-SGM9]|uniref:Cmx/CmrA family chloramphenicol efflux MFS transporter n=1 Tax=unclassified Brevibacterium TaxID=2614124 RepID=UPI001E3C74AD|nr:MULTISPECIES: Cmx/CmrA family chloramphenicol efflux MFS transporter [unclassified Brevibacterium]MCD1285295.1 chloramphenicol efflux pump [Brevibacterium sp. CCUG 69071]MDK8434340.1 MFS transporter [Brevibacterium sp. H-BE7]
MPFALYILALAVFVMGTSEFMLAGLLPAIAVELDVSVGTAGLLSSAYAVGMVIGAPTMAAFARRWPPRLTLIACLLVFGGSHVVGALTSVFPLLVVTRVLSAFANAGFLAVALNTATALVPDNLKGRALSILLSGTTLATIAGVPAGSLLGTALGWRSTFWSIAVLCVVAAIGIIRGVADGIGRSAEGAAPSRLLGELGQLVTPRLAVAMTLGALANGGTFAAFTFLAPVVTGSAGLAEVWVSVVLMVFGVGSFLGVTAAGRLSDRWPGRVLIVGGPLLLAGWIVLALSASHPGALIVLVFFQGVISFALGSTVITRVMYAASAAPTMGGSYATASLNVGAAAGPVLGAIGLSAGLGLLAPVWVASVLTAIALVVMLLFRRVIVLRDT